MEKCAREPFSCHIPQVKVLTTPIHHTHLDLPAFEERLMKLHGLIYSLLLSKLNVRKALVMEGGEFKVGLTNKIRIYYQTYLLFKTTH